MRPAGVIRLCALGDLLITALFALPFLAGPVVELLFWLNNLISHEMPVPELLPFHMLFINLMGTLGVVWALGRVLRPIPMLGMIDAWARLWVTGLLIYFLTQPGVPAIMALFIATELLGAWAQFWKLRTPEF